MPSRINAGTALFGLGAIALIIGLFIDWYEPGVTAWTVFEVVDLLLAFLAIAALYAVARIVGAFGRAVDARWPLVIATVALVLVVTAMINNPPAVVGAELESGAWISFAGAVVMMLGAVLSTNRVSVEISFAPRASRAREPVAGAEPADPDAETRRYPTTPD
ncbi:MAG TPA: hypothetical protein VK326_11990 [Solirubrobacterales bacterium]|nr:hypothetical protein [Solirubrobacterales bacterium]